MKKILLFLGAFLLINSFANVLSMETPFTQEQLDQQLIRSTEKGYADTVQNLLVAGANPDIRSIFDIPVLISATFERHINIVKILLAAGANPNVKSGYDQTALTVASIKGYIEIMKVLLSSGANPDIGDSTALHSVAYNEDIEPIKVLLAAGSNPEIANIDGNTPLISAARKGRVKVVKLLLAAGANPTKKNKRSVNATDVAKIPEIKSIFFEKMKPSIDLQTGSKTGKPNIICNALKDGALINMPDQNGNTALHLAIMSGNLDAVKYLLQFANLINFSLKNNEEQTVIDLVAYQSKMLNLIQQATVKK